MNDETLERLVSLYLDGELNGLSRWRRWQIHRRLAWCEKTKSCYELELAYRQVIVSKCREQVPSHLQERIVAALHLTDPPGFSAAGPADARPPEDRE